MKKVTNQGISPSETKIHYAKSEIIDGRVMTLCGQQFRDAVPNYEFNSVDCAHCGRIFDRQHEQLVLM